MSSYFQKQKNTKEEHQQNLPKDDQGIPDIQSPIEMYNPCSIKSLDRSTSSPSTNPQNASQNQFEAKKQEEEKGFDTGEYLKSGIYGGLDGLINTLSLILGGLGAGAGADHILLICLAGLIGDGISMGLGDYLSSKSQIEFIKAERLSKQTQIKNSLKQSNSKMQKIYCDKGYRQYQAKILTDCLSTNPKTFMNILIIQDTGLGDVDGSPAMNGIVNFLCFTLFGFLPIFPYVLNKIFFLSSNKILIASLTIGGLLLLLLGIIKAWLTGSNVIKSGMVTLLLGSFAVTVGYGIGVIIES